MVPADFRRVSQLDFSSVNKHRNVFMARTVE
jgi:hypothetical protein